MRERGIIFNAEMVRAVLEGRKTQTRRVIVPSMRTADTQFELHQQPDGSWVPMHTFDEGSFDSKGCERPIKCPFGAVGDRLWVRETWAEAGGSAPELQLYRANYPAHVPSHYENVPPAESIRWRPSIHMPRWASRITLEITGVRVERLASISPDDARSEGYPAEREADGGHLDPWLWFRGLWDGIYPEQSFKANPWVWVIEFKRVEGQ